MSVMNSVSVFSNLLVMQVVRSQVIAFLEQDDQASSNGKSVAE